MAKTVFPGIEVRRVEVGDEAVIEEGPLDPEVEPIAGLVETVVGDRDRISYTLRIKAFTEIGAIAKARAYVRAKNPFEIDRLDIVNAEMVGDKLVNRYTVTVGVTKN